MFPQIQRNATRLACGTISFSSSTRLLAISDVSELMPVTLPPGRAKLATRPLPMGSAAINMTMGILAVACLAAWTGASPPAAAMISTGRPTSSTASAESRSSCPSAGARPLSRFFQPLLQSLHRLFEVLDAELQPVHRPADLADQDRMLVWVHVLPAL